jgi:hypothetical protein
VHSWLSRGSPKGRCCTQPRLERGFFFMGATMTPDEIEQDRQVGTNITAELVKNTVAPFAIGILLGLLAGFVIARMW